LRKTPVDLTLAFRALCDTADGNREKLLDLFTDKSIVELWLTDWQKRCKSEETLWGDADSANESRANAMRQVNPWIIPRNHRVEEALQAASDLNNFSLFESLLAALEQPFIEQTKFESLAVPASASFTDSYRTFCGP